MIEKTHGAYHLFCDICEEEAEYGFGTFEEAIDYKIEQGWRTQRDFFESNVWIDICPNCQEIAEEDQ